MKSFKALVLCASALVLVGPHKARSLPLGKAFKKLCCSNERAGASDSSDSDVFVPLNIPASRYKPFNKHMDEYADPVKDEDHHYGGLRDPFHPNDPTIIPPNAWENTGFAHESLWEGTSHQTKKRAFWAFPGTRWQVMPDGELHQLEGEGVPKRVQAKLSDHKFDAIHKGEVVGRFELPFDPSGGQASLKKGVYDIEREPVHGRGSVLRPNWEQALRTMNEMRVKQRIAQAKAQAEAKPAPEPVAAPAEHMTGKQGAATMPVAAEQGPAKTPDQEEHP
ncbi:hypothetical protein IE81DRAFT_367979 [Ceraceosorus guamensis]|uniref:Uncharacterized protein n=1 Tax=Ceraceosorus guamensis TaxID=1522189 RepID=A0A316VWI7_9BASI|nr:hypothetical protein IE81DRAFT_367979 [Ceraceosorus guamensis]PWN40803.1 hypothetical protein IE81DRAFT_367979 [Ceraceosorus guamensis]